ncbi:hypothetical protein JRQ81_000360 [Phrynocephalus forsythii]|uniref:DUF4587 domain-containing protein n=1 Tax=Phrynocephalus forsythii TaxID=171643 RepID=A0A9Q0Y567_9SAUR|nr:hypothetical protein JRQ81_000360 [Phrynocephalus forsythii]
MTDSDVADYMTQLKFKLLKKKLENEYENSDDFELPISATKNCGGHDYALQSALRRQKDLLQQLREQNLLEELSLPRGLPRIQKKHFKPDNVYQPPCPSLPPTITEQPRIIQQTLPQQLPTVIQPISQHPPLIAQIPSPQLSPASRSGSIKEDMVEMMLMQNAQMHQIIMQNMMLKCLPPSAFSTASGHGPSMLPYGQQPQFSTVLVRPEKSRPSTVYHHHFTTSGIPAIPSQVGFPMWPTITQPGLGTQLGRYPSDVHNVPIPVTASHSVPVNGLLGLPPSL